jgi:hypothetical protein
MLAVVAVFITPLAIMPYFGLGADVSPSAHSHLERRYGSVGLVLAGLWLAGVAALIVVAVVNAIRRRTSSDESASAV